MNLHIAVRDARYCRQALTEPNMPATRRLRLTARLDQAETFLRTHCAECGRPLTDETSIARGVGPECAKAMA